MFLSVLIHFSEFTDGIEVRDEQGHSLGRSQTCARRAIPQVLLSRVVMAVPIMVGGPVIVEWLQRYRFARVSTDGEEGVE